MIGIVISAALGVAGAGAYIERKVLKLKLATAEAKVASVIAEAKADAEAAEAKTQAIFKAFSTKINTVVSGAKAEATKAEATAQSIIAKVEADFKKL